MTIKTILAAGSGGTASGGAIELACRFARRFSAHVEGFHAKPDPLELVPYDLGIGTTFSDALFEKFTAEADARAAGVKADFVAALARHDMDLSPHAANELPGKVEASAAWREETGYGPTLVARRARFFDLVVLGRSERVIDNPYSDAVEQTLLESGRPVFLAPAKAPDTAGERVALGWNGSVEAVRAMVGALPFLTAARAATLISVGDKHQDSAKSAVEFLTWHGVKVKHINIPTLGGVGVGSQLLSAARDEGADLLAMGGYGRMPWREVLFGGATREMIGTSLLPLLLTH